MRITTILLYALAALAATSAEAGSIVSVGTLPTSEVGLTIDTPAPGTTVNADFIHANNLPDGIIFAEQQNYTLTAPLALDTGGTLATGTVLDSFFVGFNAPSTLKEHTFAVFSHAILGIEYIDGGNLVASNVLGLPSLTYDLGCADCGYETGDTATFSGNEAIFDSKFSKPGDYARVLTLSVPESATWAMMLVGFGLIGGTMRSRKLRFAIA